MASENIVHIFVGCGYMVEVSRVTSNLLGFPFIWVGTTLYKAFTSWVNNQENEESMALPFIIIWGVYISRNKEYLNTFFISICVCCVRNSHP